MEPVKISTNPSMEIGLTKEQKEHATKEAEKRNISRSALLRKWIAAGEKAEHMIIPDFDESGSSRLARQRDPVEQLFIEELPSNPEEAISIDKLRDQMKDRIDRKVFDYYREADYIDGEGGEIYYADEQ